VPYLIRSADGKANNAHSVRQDPSVLDAYAQKLDSSILDVVTPQDTKAGPKRHRHVTRALITFPSLAT
jgi:hypothetical protein